MEARNGCTTRINLKAHYWKSSQLEATKTVAEKDFKNRN
jgi:hypothetical protein